MRLVQIQKESLISYSSVGGGTYKKDSNNQVS
ncbi:hypothetical protein AAZX31_10G049800 [Glycine max]